MNTTNHKDLSHVGEKLLRLALKRANRKDMRIGAMELGNWLTDVSQTVDRVAYHDVHESVKAYLARTDPASRVKGVVKAAGAQVGAFDRTLEGIFDRFHYECPSWIDAPLHALERKLADLDTAIDKAYRDLLQIIADVFADGGRLEQGFRAAFGFAGFFKHAYPLDGTGRYRIDPDCFFAVFEERYTQYLPHQHLDRPEQIAYRRNPKSDKFATKTERALYEYLRRDMKAVAGLFAVLDGGPKDMPAGGHSWAEATFSRNHAEFHDEKGKHKVDDTDPAWNMNLARLGHALHAVEDFFAHSTFVDHASRALPASYCWTELKEDETAGPDRTAGSWGVRGPHVRARRIKKWKNGFDDNTDDWTKLKDDADVATGYFDFNDTFISLTHALDELFERPGKTAGRDIDETWTKLKEYQYRQLLEDTLELVSDPAAVWEKNDPSLPDFDEDEENLATKLVRDKMGKSLKLMEKNYPPANVVIQLVLDGPLANQPAKVKQSFKDAAQIFGQAVGAGMAGYKLYGAIKEIRLFFADPVAWLGKYVSEEVVKFLKEHAEVYLKNAVWELVGSQRIGCHSLLAKDGGRELFFEGGMECARAAHWYVVNTLVRHSRPQRAAVARDSGGGSTNTLLVGSRVDWLELLEYWLDHPFAKIKVEKETTRTASGPIRIKTRRGSHPTMSPDSLASLAKEYKPTFDATARGAPKVFTWETIADANFPVARLPLEQKKRRINNVLRERREGVVVSDGINYAFRPDLPLTIPFQKFEEKSKIPEEIDRKWWYPVLTDPQKHETVASWFDENGNRSAKMPAYAHHPRYLTLDEHKKFVEEADKLRATLEQEYIGLRSAE